MKKSLQDLALIAEIAGGIAVVLSLLYVGFQIQLNTAERRANSIESITSANRELALTYVNNSEAGIAWHKVIEGKELTKREVEIMSDSLFAHLMLLEETYSKYQEGYIDDAFLDARVALIESKVLWSSQLRPIYEAMKRNRIFSEPFLDWLEGKLRASEWYDKPRYAVENPS